MEPAVVWAANSDVAEQRFLLANGNGRSLTPGRVDEYLRGNLKYQLLPAYRKLPQFRTFDWASFDEQFVAVGQWSGEVTVVRLDDGIPPISFPAKHQRLCNAISFNQNGLLAAGLERVRNVEGLSIWDLQRHPPGSPSADTRSIKSMEPFRKLASSEAVASAQFYSGQPETLLAGIKGVGMRLYDLREGGANPSYQVSTARIHNVSIDPLNEHHFACSGLGKDCVVQIWDRRSGSMFNNNASESGLQNPVIVYEHPLTLHKNSAPNIVSLCYSKGRPGLLGVLGSNGEAKIFEMQRDFRQAPIYSIPSHGIVSKSLNTVLEQVYTKRTHRLLSGHDSSEERAAKNEHVVSIDFTNLAGARGASCMIALSNNGKLEILEIPGPPSALTISSLSTLLISESDEMSTLPARKIEKQVQPSASRGVGPIDGLKQSQPSTNRLGESAIARDQMQQTFTVISSQHQRKAPRNLKHRLEFSKALQFSDLHRQRAQQGYALDPEKNAELCRNHQQEARLWAWISST